eukprot:1161763-Pelagomonas_calceolata.AAC.3
MPAPPHSNHLGLPPLSPHLLPKPRTCTPGGGPTAAATAAGAAPGEAAAVRAAAGAAAAAAAAATVAAGVGAKAGSQDYGTSLDQGKSAGAQGGGPFGSGGDGGGGSNSGEIVEVALMGAAVTAAGNVELFTMTRGQPYTAHMSCLFSRPVILIVLSPWDEIKKPARPPHGCSWVPLVWVSVERESVERVSVESGSAMVCTAVPPPIIHYCDSLPSTSSPLSSAQASTNAQHYLKALYPEQAPPPMLN